MNALTSDPKNLLTMTAQIKQFKKHYKHRNTKINHKRNRGS